MLEIEARRWALVVGHPGHELRAFHFCERARPALAVITDGSGSHRIPRITETRQLAEELGVVPVAVFGRLTDKEAYALLHSGDLAPLMQIVDTLARAFTDDGITAVLADAAEGYNPVHDLCRALAEAAVSQFGRAIELYEFDLAGPPNGSGDGIHLVLDDAAFDRKLAAVRRYGSLAGEAAAAFEQHGLQSFRTEFLRRAAPISLAASDHVPYYERVGAERVRERRYSTVLRYGTHVRPVMEAILNVSPVPANARTHDSLH